MTEEMQSMKSKLRRLDLDAFCEDLISIINKHCIDKYSDTPDYILAQYIVDCMDVNIKYKTAILRHKVT